MGSELVLIIAGIVLKANPDWFNGAHTVGQVCFVAGIVILVVELLILLASVLGIISVGRSRNKW